MTAEVSLAADVSQDGEQSSGDTVAEAGGDEQAVGTEADAAADGSEGDADVAEALR